MISTALLGIVEAYRRHLSPRLAPRCRFTPSCSEYAATCIARHGAARGSVLALKRLARCNPLFHSGVDLPPEKARDGTGGSP
jgi:uncharacterized protein